MASSLSIALPSGGSTAVIWGVVVSAIGNLGMALSMAEIFNVLPLSGGQYAWSYILAPPKYANAISWFTGWIAISGWISLTATASALAGSLITGMIGLANEDYVVVPYQIFVIYLGYALLALALNIWGIRLLAIVNKAALIWSLAGVAIIMIVILATSSKTGFQPASFVFAGFQNETGFSDGVAWMLGLLQASFGLTGYDALIHCADELPEPSVNVPRAMIAAVLIGASSSFIFLIVLLFSINDVDGVINSSAGALLASFYQATGSVAGALCLQVVPVVAMFFAAQGILTASSRMTQSFAKDQGIPYSRFFSRMNKDGVPHNSVYLTTFLVIVFGLIYLGSSAALNAILSSSVVFLNISYCIPIALLLLRGRHLLKPEGYPAPTLTLGPIFGPICNVVGLAFTAVTTVFFLFPPALPVTGNSMNYSVVVVGIVGIVSTVMWFVSGSKNFKGPQADLAALAKLAKSENLGAAAST